MFTSEKMVKFLREKYPPGTRIRLVSMEDPYAPVAPGTEGTLVCVDDAGQFQMKWDNGRTLALIPGEDSFTVLPPERSMLKLYMPLTAELYEPDEWGDMPEEAERLTGGELASYEDKIRSALFKNRMQEEQVRGIMYGYKRVGFVLANTLQEQSYDGRYHETNKQWSRSVFVPEDGGHRHTFLINSHPAVLDGFVSEYRAELAKLHLFGAEHCESNSGEQDFTGRVLILSPDTLRESCWQPENQLWLALSGFGCQPHARGRSVLCTCLGDGETTRWNRSEFVGIIRDECIPDWAAEKLAELQHGIHEMTM